MVDEARRRRRTLWASVGVGVAVVAALVVWVAVGSDDDDPGTASGDPTGTPSATPSATPTATESPGETRTARPSRTPTSTAKPRTRPTRNALPKPIRTSFGAEVDLGNGVDVDIVNIEAVRAQAERPGEVSGPALRFTVEVTNDSGEPVNLDLAILNVYYGPDDRPAGEVQKPGGRRLPQWLPDGQSATGRYIFTVPVAERDEVRVDFGYTVEAPKVIFSGEARG